ncbi:MAG TPA: LPS export ABC transporter permease LptF, partial [Hyphomonadaceae bacterium]|nr:LPS export ABC transporter permease LptF [Hyphomonadaceae bacterium]
MIFGRLDRYVLRAVLIPLWFVVAVAVMLLVLDQMLRLFNFILRENAQVDIVWRMLATLLPEYLSLALPIGFFIAVMLAVRRFALSSELDVIKSAGMSFFRLSRIVYVLAFGLMAFNFALVAYVQPFTAYEYSKLRFQVRSTALTANVRPGEFVEMTDQITLRVGATTAGARPFKDV